MQSAQNQRHLKFFRQAANLVVNDCVKVVPISVGVGHCAFEAPRGRFPVHTASGCSAGHEAYAMDNAVQPPSKCVRVLNSFGCTDQRQERRLECVFGIHLVRDQIATNASNQRSVPANDERKCGLIAYPDETAHQLGVRQRSCRIACRRRLGPVNDLVEHRPHDGLQVIP